ncbi:MAG: hypothetical protein ABEJ36_00790 [Candidatus Nanosalina sp.]
MKPDNLKHNSKLAFLVTAVLISSAAASAAITNSSEGALQDNFDTGTYSYYGYHNRMQDSSDQLEPGAETAPNWNLTAVFGENFLVYSSRDSIPGPDNWALTRYINWSVGNTGKVYAPGSEELSGCYYRKGVTERDQITDPGVSKKDKVFGNSFANASDWDGDGKVEGVWEDPDEIPPTYSNFSCDISGKDWGYGYDTGNNQGRFHWENSENMTNVSIGDVAFADIEGKNDPFQQESPACGDDSMEFLLEELGATMNSLNKTGSFACAGRRDLCVARHGGSFAVYRAGDLVNTGEAVEYFGRSKNDKEYCVNEDRRFGVWFDQDFSKEYCQNNNLYGPAGIRWINTSYIDEYPYSVLEGVDDDINPYLYKRGYSNFISTQGDPSYGAGETPVPTGKNTSRSIDQFYGNHSSWTTPPGYEDLVHSKGFCGGDDIGENLIVQKSNTRLIDTNYSVIAIADSSRDCVLDGSNYGEVSHDKRKIYSSGDEVELDLGSTNRTISCYDGYWYGDWPVVFQKEEAKVEEGATESISFKLINVLDHEIELEVTLDAEDELEPYTQFGQGGKQFNERLDPESSELYSVEVFGANSSIDWTNISVSAEAVSANLNGSDTARADIVTVSNLTSVNRTQVGETAKDVPGIGMIQLLVIAATATAVYYTGLWS